MNNSSKNLLTDFYQLTMAYGYWKNGMAEQEAAFHLFFRKEPFKGGYAISAGLEDAINYLQNWQFTTEDIEYLASLNDAQGKPYFEQEFLQYLSTLKANISLHAIEEGELCFRNEPILRIQGPLIVCQLIETPLLNIINFQTLIATKASRITQAAQNDTVLEFGLRRAQGPDGGLSASKAAFIGGCHASSNTLAGKKYGIPVKGTHAHSWIMCFDDELKAFESYAQVMPTNCVLLVDTYDTIEGIKNAIKVGLQLKEKGINMLGIRLDSGDLAQLSIEGRKLLDQAGLQKAAIVASNDLDEYEIIKLKSKGARIDIWGIGTKLVTAFDQASIGGVYKLAALKNTNGQWDYKIKRSNDPIKITNPAIQQVHRYYDKNNQLIADAIVDKDEDQPNIVSYKDGTPIQLQATKHRQLLIPIIENGQCIYKTPSINERQAKSRKSLASLPSAYQQNTCEQKYPVHLSKNIFNRKQKLQNA